MKYTVNVQPPLLEATITEAEAKSLVISFLQVQFGIYNQRGYCHKIDQDTRLVLITELHSACAGSHEMKEIVRTATDLDRALVTVLDAIEKLP